MHQHMPVNAFASIARPSRALRRMYRTEDIMAGQNAHTRADANKPVCPIQQAAHGTDHVMPFSAGASVGAFTEEGMALPLASIRFLAHFIAQCLRSRPTRASGSDSLMRDIWLRFIPASLFGGVAAIAGGLLLPDENAVTAITLFIGVVLAAWVLSFLHPLHQVWSAFLWISGPLFSYLLVEILIGNIRFGPFLLYLSDMQSFLNLCWYYLLAALLYAISGRLRLSAGMGAIAGFVWGNLNAYLLRFRGRILFPADIHALQTAAMVTADYDWKPSLQQVLSCIWLPLFLLALMRIAPPERKAAGHAMTHATARKRLLSRAALAGASLLGIYIFFGTPVVARMGVQPSQWFTQQNGVLLNFMINLKNSSVTRPSNYATALASMKAAAERAQSGMSQNTASQSGTPKSAPPQSGAPQSASSQSAVPKGTAAHAGALQAALPMTGARPNLIVIMNEAFSDLSVLGNIHTNADPLPYLHGLTEDTIKGNAYSSVIGGNTANSEYEFLTGNTMAFLPPGMVSYQIYTSPGDYSLTGQLARYGYKTIAMHPYDRAGWNRVQVYQNFGFSETHFIDEFKNKQYVRNYVSDRSNYQELIRRFDAFRAQDGDTPLFFLNVTMQNHGGYKQTWDRLAHRVHVAETGYTEACDVEGDNAEVNQYLSLTRESDNAYKMLIEHFRKVEEPTIILLFGDHQPKLSDDFYRKVLGKAPQACSTAETERMYTVPFALWANYDIPEAQDVPISLNYLSSLLLETASLPLTPYQTFLSEMRDVVPVINSMGMCAANGGFVADENALPQNAKDYVARYRAYQYNGIFDKRNRIDDFFAH